MTFAIYLIGSVITIAGLIYAGTLLKVPGQWIAVGAIVILGLAILSGVQTTRQKDPS
jgi:hypothetical protein